MLINQDNRILALLSHIYPDVIALSLLLCRNGIETEMTICY